MQEQQQASGSGLALLLESHRGELLRFLRARCGDAAEAEDLLQELWLKLAALQTGPIANGRAYLFRMANNLVLDTRRGRMRAMARDRHWLSEGLDPDIAIADRPDPAEPADARIAREQEAAILQRAIDGLPAGARRALQLFRFDGLSQAEVAQVMGISRSGVEKHLAVAMKHLRSALADCGLFAFAASDGQGAGRRELPSMDQRQ